MTAIIILNWNGWQDTIECLKSLFNINNTEFFIVLVDNGSTDNSIIEIKEYFKRDISNKHYWISPSAKGSLPKELNNKSCILYELKDNYGFAKGNNIGLEIAKKFRPDYYLLLNNDTIVQPDFLSRLILFIRANPKYSILTPRISYYHDKNLIWNCGGSLYFGFRKYYYANKSVGEIKEATHIDIGFITGCALFFKAYIINDSPLLTERFFHGEEDFEFSCRMKRKGIKIACVLTSIIFHKVGRSLKQLDDLGKTYAYYLNRYIDMKFQMNPLSYRLWKCISNYHIRKLLKATGISQGRIDSFIKLLANESKALNEVSKTKFFEIINRKYTT